jgi:hypothetical protein
VLDSSKSAAQQESKATNILAGTNRYAAPEAVTGYTGEHIHSRHTVLTSSFKVEVACFGHQPINSPPTLLQACEGNYAAI